MKNIVLGIVMLPIIAVAGTLLLYFVELYFYVAVPLLIFGVYLLEKRAGTGFAHRMPKLGWRDGKMRVFRSR